MTSSSKVNDFWFVEVAPEPRYLARDRAGWAGGGNAMPVTLPRYQAWADGRCVTALPGDS